MSCYLLCPAMGWNVISLRCHWLWGHVVWFEVVLWRCGDPKYYSALQSTTLYYKVLLQYYSVLLQYYSVLQSTTSVLLQYYFVLQSTTPVLLSNTITTPVLFCTTRFYKVLLQYYSVLQSTTTYYSSTALYYSSTTLYYKVLLCTTEYYSSTTLYYKVALMIDPWHIMNRYWHCAEQQESSSNFTKYCPCHAKWNSWLIRVTYETSFTMRGATLVTVKHHQILRLPRNSEFKMSGENPWIASAEIKTIRAWSEHNPRMKSSSRTRRFGDLTRRILETHFVWKKSGKSLNCFRQYKDDSSMIRA